MNEVGKDKIAEACNSLYTMMFIENSQNKTFLDVECGGVQFSLVATRLGAKGTIRLCYKIF